MKIKVCLQLQSIRAMQIFLVLIVQLCQVDVQKVQYVTRFRKFSARSETGAVGITNYSLFTHNKERRMAYQIEITKDVFIKKAQVVLHRCQLNKDSCEYIQTWQLPGNLNHIIYMKNAIWSPLFSTMIPKPIFPLLKKNLYVATNATLNANAVVRIYGAALKYYFKAAVEALDVKDAQAVVLNYEVQLAEARS